MEKQLKCFVLMLSKTFPASHSRAGQLTKFEKKIELGLKIHTIRSNYPFWKKRLNLVQENKAYISVREWSGKPYRSKQIELFRFYHHHEIGVQPLYFDSNLISEPFVCLENSENKTQTYIGAQELAKNDGLVFSDFKEWFKKYDLNESMAIIHFTKFRY